jgi:hypothetical protein
MEDLFGTWPTGESKERKKQCSRKHAASQEKQTNEGGRIPKERQTQAIHWSGKGKGHGESFSSRTQDYV